MAVRNFYIEAIIDGRRTRLAGGPAAKDGGMEIHLFQRDQGAIVKAFTIVCGERNGKLTRRVVSHSEEPTQPLWFESER